MTGAQRRGIPAAVGNRSRIFGDNGLHAAEGINRTPPFSLI
jgi:hypothetical protein